MRPTEYRDLNKGVSVSVEGERRVSLNRMEKIDGCNFNKQEKRLW